MKTFTAAILSGLAAVASAASAANSDFGLVVERSGSEIDYANINANGGYFWVGKKTSTYCPEGIQGLKCPVGTGETLVGLGGSALYMDAIVAGGQFVYIDPKDGAVRYSTAHSTLTVPGAITGEWHVLDKNEIFGTLETHGGNIFCPVSEGVYKYHVVLENVTYSEDCISAQVITPYTNATGAWQYA